MLVVKDAGALPHDMNTVLTMGTFDGLHVGHQAIIRNVTGAAAARGWRSVLLTFDPHPREVLGGPSSGLGLLTTTEERMRLLEPLGLDICLVMPFTRDLSLLEPAEYFEHILLEGIGAGRIVVGYDHAFGKGRHGHTEELRRLCALHNVEVEIVPQIDFDGVKVSSTAVRHALSRGDAVQAAHFLGRPYSFSGLVQRGDGLGRTIGYPTANIVLGNPRKLLPAIGVYAVRAVLGDRTIDGMLNIGRRPTVSMQEHLSVEAHLFDFDEDIYGSPLEVHVVARIRDELRFASLQDLAERLDRDREEARALLTHELATIHTH